MSPRLRTLALLAIGFTASTVISQTVALTKRFPQFDNADVKVWKTTIEPRQPLPLHHHDHPRVLVALTRGTLSIEEAAGQKESIALEVGKAYWLPAMAPGAVHSDVNPGNNPIEVMIVELQRSNYTPPS